MIHMPIHSWPTMSRLFDGLSRARKRLGDACAFFRRKLLQMGMAKPPMRGLSYPVELFYDELPALDLGEIELSVFSTKSNNGSHPFVSATHE